MGKDKVLIHTDSVLCHPKNRAGFMLNAFNAQANGSKVKRIGANRDELHGAVVIELMPTPAEKKLQIDANVKIAAASKGMIAQPTGQERYMSIGTGHMVSFCRAANHGCVTPFKDLRNEVDGNISLEILKRDGEYKLMLEEGWYFEVLPWQTEVTWPTLPEFGQRALNAANSVATDATEWEVAITISETYENMDDPSWDLAVQAALAGNPSCASYGASIQKLVELYSGGHGAPLVREQDEFAKTMGESKRLGELFSNAIVETKFDPYDPMVHVRHALIATNLTSCKVEDHIAKLLTKSDVVALAGKDKMPTIKAANAELCSARTFALALHDGGALSRERYIEMLGLLRIRIGAHLCGKGKQTFEAIAFEDRATVLALFLKDITEHLKASGASLASVGVEFPANLAHALKVPEKHAPCNAKNGDEGVNAHEEHALSIDEVSSKDYMAKRKGFKIGSMVYEKSVGAKDGVYEITMIGDDIGLKEVDEFKDDHLTVKVPFPKFMEGWKPFTGEMATFVHGAWDVRCTLRQMRRRLKLPAASYCWHCKKPRRLGTTCRCPK